MRNSTYYCGGVTTSPSWVTYQTNGLTLTIDTSSCQFNSTPLYFTSIHATGEHFVLVGYTAIYGASKTSFIVYVTSVVGWNSVLMLNLSSTNRWDVNWLSMTF